HGSEIYIYTNSIRGCCGGQKAVKMDPQIVLGSPVDKDNYDKREYQQITVYIDQNIEQEMLAGKQIVLVKTLGIFKKLFLRKE
ncbi:MAG: CC/Se motif family (seleno)protein, partial [Halanaerobiaceae bacterium]